MRWIIGGWLAVAALATAIRAGETHSCAGAGCVPRCRTAWQQQKSHQPAYEIRSEYECVRGRDPWHAPEPECRCRPPCGRIYVKKRLYKSEGQETVERVPKYDVEMVSPRPCDCDSCSGGRGWDPLGILTFLHLR